MIKCLEEPAILDQIPIKIKLGRNKEARVQVHC
jgi:hypothetical protein